MCESIDIGIERIEQALLDMVDTANDHELFVSGYLHGHFSLVVSEAQNHGENSMRDVNKRMQVSLDAAFQQGELEQADQVDVRNLWQHLYIAK